MLFELQVMVATIFHGLDPIETRYKKAKDVLRVAKRILRRAKTEEKKISKSGHYVKKVPAGDKWF